MNARQIRSIAVSLFVTGGVLVAPLTMPAICPNCPPAAVKSDFNGDGWGDLAVGVPGETVNGAGGAGAVNVIYGSSNGLSANGNQFLHQDSIGFTGACPGWAEEDDNFGRALAVGDFNKDGFSDLAVGAPKEDLPGLLDAGVVHVFFGSANRLTCGASVLIEPNYAGIWITGWTYFGAALAVGDFDEDGFDDLAIGAPGATVVANVWRGGSVTVLYGTAWGFNHSDVWTLASPGILGDPNGNCDFGWSLAAGNFGKTPASDLAIGIPWKDQRSGAVTVIYGSPAGLTANGNQYWTQDALGEQAEWGDKFGWSLAAGNFGKSGYDDLAIAQPDEGPGGVVHIVYGSSTGLTATYFQRWLAGREGDMALAAGNFGYSYHADLAIGYSAAKVQGVSEAGSVHVMYGTTTGLSLQNAQPLYLESPAFWDHFGFALGVANFGNGPYHDLAIGIPQWDVDNIYARGKVSVRYGSSTGLGPNQLWSQDSPGILDVAEKFEAFGFALSR